MRDLLRDIEFSKNGKLFEIASKLMQKDKELKCKEFDLELRDNEMNNVDLQRRFLVEYNSQAYASFYNTKLEKDKSILTISVTGLGFLVTLINLFSIFEWYEHFVFYTAAACFMLCIFNVIKIFGKNAEYMISLTTDGPVNALESQLKSLDKWAIRSFYLGIAMAFLLGVLASLNNLKQEEKHVQREKSGIQREASATER